MLAGEGLSFRDDRVGPEHEPLPDLIRDHLKKRFAPKTLTSLQQSITTLYKFRLEADYGPHLPIGQPEAMHAERLATTVRNTMKVHLP